MSKAQKLIEEFIQRSCQGATSSLDEQAKIRLIWKKLPSMIKNKVDLKKLSDFLTQLESGVAIEKAASYSNISSALAIDLMRAIEQTGLI